MYPEQHDAVPVYDSLHSCQERKAQNYPSWPGRCQECSVLAFTLTLGTALATATIGLGLNLERSFRESNHSWKSVFHR